MEVETSRVAVFNGPDRGFSIEKFSIPKLKPNEILVRIGLCTVCGSDLHTYSGKRPGPVPGALGHEIIGSIVKFGNKEQKVDFSGKKIQIGDRITWMLYSCNKDEEISKKGFPQKAKSMFKYGHETITKNNALHSGFADYLVIRDGTEIFKLAEKLSDKQATPLNCGLATSIGAVRLSGVKVGDSCAVIGCGLLGLFTIAILKSRGIVDITAIDIDKNRLTVAKEFGASSVSLFDNSKDSKFDKIYEVSGTAVAMELAVNNLNIGGTTIFVGAAYTQRNIQISGEKILRNLLTIKGLHNYVPEDLLQAINFLEENNEKFPFESLVEKTFPLSEVNEAFEYALNNQPFRIGVYPGE